MSHNKPDRQPAARPDEEVVQILPISQESLDALPLLIDRAPRLEPGQVRKGLEQGLWELDGSKRSMGRAQGSRAATQLMLGESVEGHLDDEGLPAKIGSDMTWAQRRAIHALYVMLHDRAYQPDDSKDIATGSEIVSSSLIVCSVAEYLAAYGLEKTEAGRVNRNQRDEALEALFELGRQNRKITIPAYKTDGKKRVRIRVDTDGPLLQIAKQYTGLSEAEQQQDASPDNKRLTKLMVQLHPLMTYDLSRRFYLQPRDWYQQLAAAYQRVSGKLPRKLPVSIDMFCHWLSTIDSSMAKSDEAGLPIYTISREKLAQKILPGSMIAQRRKREQDAAIRQSIDVAIELGLLLGWEPAMNGTGYTFRLNPGVISRLRGWEKRAISAQITRN